MLNDMPKTYEHKDVEQRLYEKWEKSGYFHAEPNPDKAPYCIVIPPPNITGRLHMGHALDNTLQDAIIRYKRMSGYETLWLPGTDHASIATEVKIVEALREEGIDKRDLGREKFLARAWQWREEYGRAIVTQLKKLGSSCDWERERFTMDEGCNKAVIKVFCDLYKRGLIYRGDRIINWCPTCKTALSDAEVEYEEQTGSLWHVRYMAPDGSYGIVCATTRPETIPGDTAVAVHPEDARYQALIGKTVLVPAIGREIPIIADEYVEMEFGSGAVKITPCHDPNDFEVGLRHALPRLRVITDDGHINELGAPYTGMTTRECRKAIVADMEKQGTLVKIEDYTHNVGTCYRCHSTVEPLTSEQWFVSMKPLAEAAIKAVEEGDIKIVPERFAKTYFNWMYNIKDWCISRQLWWGHRIPAWYCDACGDITVQEEDLACCPKCGAPVRQDEDVLDTWFSSGMWPFSTLGYPQDTPALRYFYPTSTLVTGYDIIFFWVARMIVFGMDVMKQKPFDTVYVHGIVRDAQGRKMSKSLGNGIDPLEIIQDYGADALRFSLVTGGSAGSDMRFSTQKVESARNFCNKVYNAVRFALMNMEAGTVPAEINMGSLDVADKWILHRLNETVREVTRNLDAFELNIAAQKIYDFIWSEFCDWYIEMAKSRLYGDNDAEKANVRAILLRVLTDAMKMLHPFMPFITEELYQYLPYAEETIMRTAWPQYETAFEFPQAAEAMGGLMEVIRGIRNIRAEMNVPPSKRTAIMLVSATNEAGCREAAPYVAKLAFGENLSVQTDKANVPTNAVSVLCPYAEAYIPLEQLVDIEKERARVAKEIARIEGEIARAQGKLNNAGFVAKAPEHVIAEERSKLESAEDMLKKLQARLVEL